MILFCAPNREKYILFFLTTTRTDQKSCCSKIPYALSKMVSYTSQKKEAVSDHTTLRACPHTMVRSSRLEAGDPRYFHGTTPRQSNPSKKRADV